LARWKKGIGGEKVFGVRKTQSEPSSGNFETQGRGRKKKGLGVVFQGTREKEEYSRESKSTTLPLERTRSLRVANLGGRKKDAKVQRKGAGKRKNVVDLMKKSLSS